jgi:hypothetical protein
MVMSGLRRRGAAHFADYIEGESIVEANGIEPARDV